MRRYVTRPRGWYDDWRNEPGPAPLTISVLERERAPEKTGLLDKQGNELFAVDDMEPIGFVRRTP